MNEYDSLKEKISEIEQKIKYVFEDKELLLLSFVHRSFVNENKKIIEVHNERLEFLGDAILNLVVSEYLFKKFPKATEGELSFLRSQIVDSNSCMGYVRKLNLDSYVLLGKGEKQTEDRGRDSILADLFEAVIGAVFLDGGFFKAKDFILNNFEDDFQIFLEKPTRNFKAEFQNFCQKKYLKLPNYKIIKESGPDHSKVFEVGVYIDDTVLGIGTGPSKKEAEQAAAEKALKNL
jgi:ribonuclease-3